MMIKMKYLNKKKGWSLVGERMLTIRVVIFQKTDPVILHGTRVGSYSLCLFMPIQTVYPELSELAT